MKKFHWFKQISNNNINSNAGLGRRLSLGEYRRAISWSKYLVSSGAEIKGEGEQEWSADMSQLFIGNKFASGRHSRIYRGIYKQRDVAIKLISQPQEDEDLASFLEKQFSSEVALLFRLTHPNIITVNISSPLTPFFFFSFFFTVTVHIPFLFATDCGNLVVQFWYHLVTFAFANKRVVVSIAEMCLGDFGYLSVISIFFQTGCC
ncbi:unnamed protein product [Linum tenue]|uniref:Protein kinase domain-containing protein n=1 Tax=Linum tenue TaxID=586396 RepID=A0AAV0IMH5_9ROSI|nr:unnamed protein product [Linum tenue]